MAVKAAVFSTDPALRTDLARVIAGQDAVSVVLEVDSPFTDIQTRHLDQLETLDPELAFLDLEHNPGIALRFAQFLIESNPSRKLIGFGADLSPELLLSAMQAGISEYVEKPIDESALREAMDRVIRKLGKKAPDGSRQPGKLLVIFSPKGGSGSTTLATNLAVELHRVTRKRTLLVDLDLELGETALTLGIEPRFSVVDLLRNFHRVDSDLLASYIDRHESGLEVLAAPYAPADPQAVDVERVGQILDFLRSAYEYVVVDAPKSFNTPTVAALQAADEVFLVTTPDLASIRNLARSLPLLRELRRSATDGSLRLVVNRADSRELISGSEIEKALGLPAYWTVSNDYRAVIEALNAGRPVVDDNRSVFGRDVRGLAGVIGGVEVTTRPSRFGFLPFGSGRRRAAAGGRASDGKVTNHAG
ncbi:MAG: AAA family ATPase [Gemmatimonadetes bacterium]|nr:AAA family ATPase [Gemmatimonadota bacterium]